MTLFMRSQTGIAVMCPSTFLTFTLSLRFYVHELIVYLIRDCGKSGAVIIPVVVIHLTTGSVLKGPAGEENRRFNR